MSKNPQLTFALLREANTQRLPTFKNARGELAHTEPDGSDWSPSDWSNALAGEVGELANLIKKVRRGDFTLAQARDAVAKEIADVATYLDLLAMQFGIDVGAAVTAKFNEISERVGSPISIRRTCGGSHGDVLFVHDARAERGGAS